MESLIRGHSLVAGNKRLGFNAVVVFYDLNDFDLVLDDEVAYDLVIDVATANVDLEEIATVLANGARPIKRPDDD